MMSGWSFAGQFCLAMLALATAVYVPGRLLLRALRLDLECLEHYAAALMSGTGLLVLVYWTLSMLGVQNALWMYLLLAVGLELFLSCRDWMWDKRVAPDPEAPRPEQLADHWPLGLLLLAGIAAQARFTFFSGWLDGAGVGLLAWHAHDAPWHIYNLHQLAHVFPPAMPGFSGQLLKNYHMFSDLLWGAVLHVLPLDPWHVYFRIAPLYYSAMLMLSTFVTARRWSGQLPVAYLAAAMTMFCANFGYVMPLLCGRGNYFIWDSIFWVQPPMSMIFNPGVSSSFSVFMMGLWALVGWTREKKGWGYLALLALYWGVLPGFKVYPAVLAVAGLLVAGGILFLFQRDYKQWLAAAALAPLFLYVFLPPNLHAPSLVRFLPGFNLGSMLVAPDRMALMSSLQLKMLFVQKPWLVALIMAGLALVFLVGNLGVRVLGLLPMIKTLVSPRKADPVLLLMTVIVGGAWAAPLLFVQEGVPWNVVQFFYYAVLLAALPAARQVWSWLESVSVRRQAVWLCVLFAFGLPGAIQALLVIRWEYRTGPKVLQGLEWLKKQVKPGETILRPLPDPLLTDEGFSYWKRTQVRGRMTSMKDWEQEAKTLAAQKPQAPTPSGEDRALAETLPEKAAEPSGAAGEEPGLRDDAALPEQKTRKPDEFPDLERTDAAIVAALALQNTYLEDTVSAQIMGFAVEERVEAVRAFYRQMDVVQARSFLEKENIMYVVLFAGQQLPFVPAGVPLKQVYANDSITIYKHVKSMVW
ncbi:hypothetical protein JW933_11155 [candidate division FCPU426 bacterium]|nr:hypothetical protein [candidate division FCPU426 bacterium]